MMIILGNGTIFTRDAARPMIKKGAIAMDEGVIKEVGQTADLKKKYSDAEFVDAHGKLIMPGFVNAHHHIYSALARGLAMPNYNPSNFNEILEDMWFTLDKNLNHDSVWASAALTYLGCIENGVTSVIDHHASYGETLGSLSIIAKEAQNFGVRSCLCYEISDRNGKEEMKKAVAENMRFAHEDAKDDPKHLAPLVGLHASFTVSDETLDYVISQNDLDLGYHVHVAEAPSDVEHCQKTYGKTITQRFYDKGILKPTTIAGHCLHITEEEMKLFAETGASVVYCAESNMGNSVGLPQMVPLYENGVHILMGTDGYTSDMLESYKAANCAAKYKYGHTAGWVENSTALFKNNPEMISRLLDVNVGVLKEGYAADVIVVDYNPPTRMDENNIDGHLLFGVCGKDVITTISDGIVRMQDREVKVVDKDELLERIRKVSDPFWTKLGL